MKKLKVLNLLRLSLEVYPNVFSALYATPSFNFLNGLAAVQKKKGRVLIK
jgi:hypothetical protein